MNKAMTTAFQEYETLRQKVSDLQQEYNCLCMDLGAAIEKLRDTLCFMERHTKDEELQDLVSETICALFDDDDDLYADIYQIDVEALAEYIKDEYDSEADEDPVIDDDQSYSLFPSGTIGAPV